MEENGKKKKEKETRNQNHKKDLQCVCHFFQTLWASHEALSDPAQLIKVPEHWVSQTEVHT